MSHLKVPEDNHESDWIAPAYKPYVRAYSVIKQQRTEVAMEITVFRDVMQRILIDSYPRFGRQHYQLLPSVQRHHGVILLKTTELNPQGKLSSLL
jgi:hypothetical protein